MVNSLYSNKVYGMKLKVNEKIKFII